jgi:nitroreductase
LLDSARWSPSGGNLQPWKLIAVAGAEREAVISLAHSVEFHGAPVGLFFVFDRRLGRGQWAHLGMFMQSLALVAVERGLGTCRQDFPSSLRDSLHRHFALPDTDMVYCGMALGHADPAAGVDTQRPDRTPVAEFAVLKGF